MRARDRFARVEGRRLTGIVFEALFAALRAILFLPARLLGARRPL